MSTQNAAWTSHKEQIRKLSDRLVSAQGPIRILDALKWDEDAERDVIVSRFKRLPTADAEYYR